MSILRRATKPATGVVDTVQQQTSEAAALARIDGQERLANPRTNPVVRPHADRLQNEQQLAALDAAHTRKLRTHRVADRRAEHAERALEAIQAARETSSAAQSVLALHQGRTRFMGAAMAASLMLSVGSAMGVEQFALDHHAPEGVGYIAEVGLTGLATTAILYRSHLAQHDGKVEGWHEKALYALMFGPLIASMIANFKGAGPIGIACSVGAAAFALLSDLVATASSSALHKKANEVSGDDEAALRAVVSDSDTFTAVANSTKRQQELATDQAPVAASQPRQLAADMATETAGVGDISTPPTGDVPVASDRQDESAPVAKVAEEVAPAPRQRRATTTASRKRNTRRSMDQWVELASPIFHAEFERLRRPPTGDEFAEAIRKARLGTVSASTAKNIRTEILDREPVPSLESLKDPS